MKKILHWLDINLESAIGGILFFAILLVITVQVILRNVFGQGVPWAEEVCKFLFVWMCYIGVSYSTRMNTHIVIDVFRKLMPEKIQKILVVLIQFVFMGLFIVLLYGSIRNVYKVHVYNSLATSMNISLNWMYIAAPIGYGLSIIRLIQTIIWKIKYFNAPWELFMDEEGAYSGGEEMFCTPEESRQEILDTRTEEALKYLEERGK